jgi:bidirectional [NiFe] hydrogenase diaphorase subunit
MDHVRFPYLFPDCNVDGTNKIYNIDHNRCIMCTKCVRTCDEVEGAHTWDVRGRGFESRIIADFDEAWGTSPTCTLCGKCVSVCPTGALWHKQSVQNNMKKSPEMVSELTAKRGRKG